MIISLVYSKELLYHTLSATESTNIEQQICEVSRAAVVIDKFEVIVADALIAIVLDCAAASFIKLKNINLNIIAFNERFLISQKKKKRS